MRIVQASILALVGLSNALQGSNFDIDPEFANSHGCNQTCQDALREANKEDLADFGHDFNFALYKTSHKFAGSKPGDLLKLVPMNPGALHIKAETEAYRIRAYHIQYTSQDLDGSPVPATGFLVVPWARQGRNYPPSLVAWAHGTSGMYRGCAPSNGPRLYDYDTWQLIVERGYTVVAPDYPGLGNNYTTNKLCSFSALAKDVYYSVQAAKKANSTFSSGKWVAAGHSEGGGAVWKLSESHLVKNDTTYLGAVALAPPTKLIDTLQRYPENLISSGYLTVLARALKNVYPSYNLTMLAGRLRERLPILEAAQPCVAAHRALVAGLSPGQIFSPEGLRADLPLLMKWQNETAPASGTPSTGPLLVVQGLKDRIVAPAITRQSFGMACSKGLSKVHLSEYTQLDHSTVLVGASNEWLEWIGDRFKDLCQVARYLSALT
ncbi:hypothetical protein EsHS_00004879 [Epichloe bromicola]